MTCPDKKIQKGHQNYNQNSKQEEDENTLKTGDQEKERKLRRDLKEEM